MSKFSKGQTITCIKKWFEEDEITEGKEYTVVSQAVSSESDMKAIWIIDDVGDMDWYPEDCFE